MKTLIELLMNHRYSMCSLPLHSSPKSLYFRCRPVAGRREPRRLQPLFKSRGESPEIEYISADMENIDEVNDTLAKIISENPDCVVDVTGGKDIALLAAGMAAVKLGVPLIAYNRRTKKYANISKYEHAMRANIFGLLDCEDFSMSAAAKLSKAKISANTETTSALSGQRCLISGTSILKTSAPGCHMFSFCRE